MSESWENDEQLDEQEFTELMREMVNEDAPRLFAVVQELGERIDGRVAAWGMAFPDHAEVVRVSGGSMTVRTPDRARELMGRRPGVSAHLVWLDPQVPSVAS